MLLRTTAAILLATLAAPLTAAHAQPSVPGSGVTATTPWTRATTTDTAAVYVTLKSPVQDRLIAVTTPGTPGVKAEIDLMVVDGGITVARALPAGLALPPGQPVALQPGGYLIGLTGLTKPLQLNDTFPLRLTFAISQPIDLTARVAAIGPSNPPAANPTP